MLTRLLASQLESWLYEARQTFVYEKEIRFPIRLS
jgi:hypothetical protein